MADNRALSEIMLEHKVLDLTLDYMDVNKIKDSRLIIEALKFLGILLCNERFSSNFFDKQGVELLVNIPRPSSAATGVNVFLFATMRFNNAMIRVSRLPKHVLKLLVQYGMWLLTDCPHKSGRYSAALFFSVALRYRAILEMFDALNGLPGLYCQMSTLHILSVNYDNLPNDYFNREKIEAERQLVRDVGTGLKNYFQTHLNWKIEVLRNNRDGLDEVSRLINSISLVQKMVPFRGTWAPVSKFIRLGGITLFLRLIAVSYLWRFDDLADTLRNALVK